MEEMTREHDRPVARKIQPLLLIGLFENSVVAMGRLATWR